MCLSGTTSGVSKTEFQGITDAKNSPQNIDSEINGKSKESPIDN
jgi:hypothetical protein